MKNVIKLNFSTLPWLCVAASLILILSIISCEDEEGFESELNSTIASLPDIKEKLPAIQDTMVTTEKEKDLEYEYTIKNYTVAAGYDEQTVLNPQTDVIYPGALIKGESILDGSYIPISAKRKPITISTSLTGGDKVSVEVTDPKLSTVRAAINGLMKQTYDVPPANIGFTIEQAYSASQLQLALRASYKGGAVNVAAGFDYNKKEVKSRLIVKFIQSYYTLDMDLPNAPSDLFLENVNSAAFGSYMPMYVSTVTFGRIALFTVESSLQEDSVRAYLNGSYASVAADASAAFNRLKSTSTMKVYILGGSGGDAGKTIDGFEAFKNYIITGSKFSKDSPGAPISYKLRYIKDNSIGKIVFSASYPIRTAVPRTDNIRYDVDIYLYELKAFVETSGDYSTLNGEINSYVSKLPGNKYNHFLSGITVKQSSIKTYSSTDAIATKAYKNLTPNDTIVIKPNITATSPTYNFTGNFNYPVSKFGGGPEKPEGSYDTLNEIIIRYTSNPHYYFYAKFKFNWKYYRAND